MTEKRPESESELVEFVRSIDLRAPESLHRSVEALVGERVSSARQRRIRLGAPAAARRRPAVLPRLAGLAAVVALLAVLLIALLPGGGSPGHLSIQQAAALALERPITPAPTHSARGHDELTASVDGISFPYWEDVLGWRATGSRSDRLGGRAITTVYYADARGRRVGYAIVAGTPAPRVSGGRVAVRAGTAYRLLAYNGAMTVAWLRQGHLCVLSGRGVSAAVLLRLASWQEAGAIRS